MLTTVSLGATFSGGVLSFTTTGSALQVTVGATILTFTNSSITAAGKIGIQRSAGAQFSSYNAS